MAQAKLKKSKSKIIKKSKTIATKSRLKKIIKPKTKPKVSVNKAPSTFGVNQDLNNLLQRARNLRKDRPVYNSPILTSKLNRNRLHQEQDELEDSLPMDKIEAIKSRLKQYDDTSRAIQAKATHSNDTPRKANGSSARGVSPYAAICKSLADSSRRLGQQNSQANPVASRKKSVYLARRQSQGQLEDASNKMNDSVDRLTNLYQRLRSMTGA
ncbi:MAG: hypothetical protein ACI9CF_001340 [Candidatus Omnitrophota bacterium]|jgi:hypothetical protein